MVTDCPTHFALVQLASSVLLASVATFFLRMLVLGLGFRIARVGCGRAGFAV